MHYRYITVASTSANTVCATAVAPAAAATATAAAKTRLSLAALYITSSLCTHTATTHHVTATATATTATTHYRWQEVAASLPGKSEIQCMLHWRLILNPNQPVRGIGSWSSEEDSRLHALVAAHGAKWSLVARR
jgi:hypothetical protein